MGLYVLGNFIFMVGIVFRLNVLDSNLTHTIKMKK